MRPFWLSRLSSTLRSAARLTEPSSTSPHVVKWLAACDKDSPASSNVGSLTLPFQRWVKFKEAFSPKFVVDALASLRQRPRNCLDPFGGSGTTALTCALLGIGATTIEVNPYLADVISAKTTPTDSRDLVDGYLTAMEVAASQRVNPFRLLRNAPPTLCEPGVRGRYVFSRPVLSRILALRQGIGAVASDEIGRLLRVLLGSTLVFLSNIVVNGKGRRYRGQWWLRTLDAADVDEAFGSAVRKASRDLAEYGLALRSNITVLKGDARERIREVEEFDVAIFSPPYPNSFDYTDVYNLELWVLGYLANCADNTALRRTTLRSHVQVSWPSNSKDPAPSLELQRVLSRLEAHSERLWDRRLPQMVDGYFRDMTHVLCGLKRRLHHRGHIVMVVGDSCYAGVRVRTARILAEVAQQLGYRVLTSGAIRSMRNSAQHGGRRVLGEECLVLRR